MKWWMSRWWMSRDPCENLASDLQACLSKNNSNPKKCDKVIESLQLCCKTYKSTHCNLLSKLRCGKGFKPKMQS